MFDATENSESKSMISIHSMGLREAARFLGAGHPVPPITVIGVEPQSLDYGMELSPLAQAAMERVVLLARETVAGWMRENESKEAPCRAVSKKNQTILENQTIEML
jgi:Ni,Fe-hydrogenase maturation factor